FRTCQDKDNFDEGVLTLRFIASDADPSPYDAIPSLASISTTAPVLEPGISMGERESVTVTLVDHMHSDTGIDKYVSERGYDPLRRGTLWGRLRARIPSLRGRALRVYRGEHGQLLSEMHVRHYIIESHSGPHGNSFTIVAKDPLRFLDGDRAQAPSVTPGILAESITDSQILLRLSPSGVGDAYYPSSGKAAIGGSEIVSFNRTGDSMSITRGQSNTAATSHDAGAVVQLVLEYNSETVANIIYDLITNYTDVDPSWINLSAWQEEVDQYIGRLYS